MSIAPFNFNNQVLEGRPSKFSEYFQKALSSIAAVLKGVGPRLTITATLTFPPIAPQSSQGLPVVVPGAVPDAGQTVLLGVPSDTIFTVNWAFTAVITAPDEVTVLEHCYDSFGIGAYTGAFTVQVFT